MPHGENVILVLKDGVVQRAIYKDIAEEIAVMDPDAVLPPEVSRIAVEVPEDKKLLSIFTDVFDCFFRFLAANLAGEGIVAEDVFWRTVAEVTREYQESVPELAEKFDRYDMFAPEFALSCLNRLQLRNNEQMGGPRGTRPARSSSSEPEEPPRGPVADGPSQTGGHPGDGPPGCPSGVASPGQPVVQGTCGDR